MYVIRTEKSVFILSLYVDDILLAGNDMKMFVTAKGWLSSTFKMNMGEANYVLGIKIRRDRPKKLLNLSKETYIEKVLEQFRMHNSKPIDTPIRKGYALSLNHCAKNDEENKKKNGYNSLCKCSWKYDVHYVAYTTRHLPCNWHGQSLPK